MTWSNAAAIDIHGVWLVSVKTIPENPAASTSQAVWAASAHVVAPTITSICIPESCPLGR